MSGTSSGTTYTDAGLTSGTAYTYTVAAYDAAGNVSAKSTAVSATTSSASSGGGCMASMHVEPVDRRLQRDGDGDEHEHHRDQAWKVSWTWPGGQTVNSMWNAVSTASGSSETATNEPYNGAIAASGSTSFGLQASGGSANPVLTCSAT